MGSASFIPSEMVKITVFMSLLCFSFSLYECKGCLEEERIALLQLWDSFNPHGSDVYTKLEEDDCCQWFFVKCDLFNSTNRVVIIYLSYQSYTTGLGTLYPNASLFTQFRELRSLYLDGNNIGGWIMPEALCELQNLKVLSLSENSLNDSGLPRCLARDLPFLKYISLQGNFFNLSFPLLSALCGSRNLRVLDLSHNIVSNGGFPPCMLGTFSLLERLSLQNFTLEQSPNVLTALEGARNLRHLDLRYNNLSDGSLKALCGARNLKTLHLGHSSLNVESIPPCLPQSHSYLEKLFLERIFIKGSYALLKGLICGWKQLKMLDLHLNDLSDESLPSCLWHNNSLLEELHLSSNNLKGSLGFTAAGLCKLRKLRHIDLTMNSIDDIHWPCLSQLNSLQTLYLGQNQISGTIPPLISNLTSLVKLDLSNNKLDGVVFFSMFANLSKLERINLSNNRELEVETEFPSYWVPSFQLNSLHLGSCKLNMRTHGNIPHFISTQYSLDDLSLSYNSLRGTVPSWLFYNATPHFYSLILKGNHLHGPLPLPLRNETSMLGYLDISDNNIEGQLPRNIDVLFPYLAFFNMSTNKLEGCIPPSFGNLISIATLDLSNNSFVGEVPHRLTQNNSRLLFLSLSNNHLHAMPRVSNVTNLQILSLDGNLFTKPISITPSSVPSLQILDLSRNSISGNIQDWLHAFPYMVSLLIRENHFVGSLPASLCQMQRLCILDMSNNHLFGSIPPCVNNITSWLEESVYLFFGDSWSNGEEDIVKVNFATKGHLYSYEGLPLYQMTGIDLSQNQLTGDIPSQLGELRALHSLNLSHNSLIGYIPESFQGLENLESLDLSNNKLVGKIPSQMIQLSFLSDFNVAFNQLSGKIPYENNFATFTMDSYIGNQGLCGPPTEVNCSSPQPQHHEYKKIDDDEQSLIDNDLFFYSYVVLSYALGFWIVVAPLLLSRNWRRKYYRVVDKCIDWCSDGLFWFLFYIKNCWKLFTSKIEQ
ncbi:receptor-like protein 56 [Macadamia integrifolia]|uniref:receptor-like protein 56 n=1 Tax=Macadamia integrifolia TaxID=60698 RepID=UPI001C4E889C|nr:receptor-like protein 56 [Macadamia integrifolia]